MRPAVILYSNGGIKMGGGMKTHRVFFLYLHKRGNDTATGVVIMTDGREGGEREWMRIEVASCSNELEHVYKDP